MSCLQILQESIAYCELWYYGTSAILMVSIVFEFMMLLATRNLRFGLVYGMLLNGYFLIVVKTYIEQLHERQSASPVQTDV